MPNVSSLYDRLGGGAAVSTAVGIFYGKVLADPDLAPFFAGVPVDRLMKKQVAFMTMAFGGPNEYTGRDLRAAHAAAVNKGLSDEHFDAVAKHLAASLRELKVSDELVREVLAIVGTTRADVLGK